MSSNVPNEASPGTPAEPSASPTPAAPTPPSTRREVRAAEATETTVTTGWSGPLIVLGVLSVALGILVLVWPEATLLVVAIVFGLQLIAAGAVRLALSREIPSDPGWLKPVSIALGAASVVAGIICLFRPNASLFVIAILIAIGWIADGIGALAQGFSADRSTGSRVFLIVLGVVAVLGGIVVAVFPGSSLVALTRLAGVVLIVIGIAELVTAAVARRARAAVAPDAPGATAPA